MYICNTYILENIFVQVCSKYISPATRQGFFKQNDTGECSHVRYGFTLTQFSR